jgi:hypothetical protein
MSGKKSQDRPRIEIYVADQVTNRNGPNSVGHRRGAGRPGQSPLLKLRRAPHTVSASAVTCRGLSRCLRTLTGVLAVKRGRTTGPATRCGVFGRNPALRETAREYLRQRRETQ